VRLALLLGGAAWPPPPLFSLGGRRREIAGGRSHCVDRGGPRRRRNQRLAPGRDGSRTLSFRLLASRSRRRFGRDERADEAASRGDVEAQIVLGRIYLQGVPTVPRDAPRARDWFLRAAPSRHPSAAYFLGVMSQSGQGTRPTPRGRRAGSISRRREDRPTRCSCSRTLPRGRGGAEDDAKAVELYEKAGEGARRRPCRRWRWRICTASSGSSPTTRASRYMMAAEHAIKHKPLPP
jgi:hypothetical protein